MPLSEENKNKITKNYSDIVHKLKHDSIADELISESVITPNDLQIINAKVTQSDKNRELITILLKGPSNGYQIFIRELREDAIIYGWLADQIENTAVTKEVPLTLGNYERLNFIRLQNFCSCIKLYFVFYNYQALVVLP